MKARAAAGLSLRELESKIDNLITARALSKYEQDEMMPGSQVLIAIAKALGVSEDYLLSEQELSLDGVEFRKKAKMSVKEQAQVEAQVLHLFERYLAVEELLGLTIEWDKPREAPYPVLNDVNEADRAARSLRQDWGLGLDPLPNLVELFYDLFPSDKADELVMRATLLSGLERWLKKNKLTRAQDAAETGSLRLGDKKNDREEINECAEATTADRNLGHS